MGGHQPVNLEKEDIERARAMWHNFTQLLKWSIIVTLVVLAALGIIFIDW